LLFVFFFFFFSFFFFFFFPFGGGGGGPAHGAASLDCPTSGFMIAGAWGQMTLAEKAAGGKPFG
jgi:hypothetical protein